LPHLSLPFPSPLTLLSPPSLPLLSLLQVECGSVVFLVLTFLLSSLFLYFWSQAHNDYNDFDWFKFETLGFWFPWSLVLLVVAAALFTYISLLLVLAVCLLSEGQRLYLHWSHKMGIVVTMAFSVSATAVLSEVWSKEWKTLLLSLQVGQSSRHRPITSNDPSNNVKCVCSVVCIVMNLSLPPLLYPPPDWLGHSPLSSGGWGFIDDSPVLANCAALFSYEQER
uniref:Glycerophosphodiester phosphodiesterase domain containing 4a n=2 Tax=Hucho hucho TaxID=62062 RepID=A0A4W5LE22_9TELE